MRGAGLGALALAAALWTTAGAAPSSPALAPSTVLARYQAALAAQTPPRFAAYVYSVEQAGATNLLETHRVYRSGADVRDETIAVDGRRLPQPLVRMVSGRRDPYAVGVVAPRVSRYQFTYAGSKRIGERVEYRFHTIPFAAAAFAVDDVTIDGTSFLPRAIHFRTAGARARGSGALTYGPVGGYWMIQTATARATVADQESREYITWSGYRFPSSLPPATFSSSGGGGAPPGQSGPRVAPPAGAGASVEKPLPKR